VEQAEVRDRAEHLAHHAETMGRLAPDRRRCERISSGRARRRWRRPGVTDDDWPYRGPPPPGPAPGEACCWSPAAASRPGLPGPVRRGGCGRGRNAGPPRHGLPRPLAGTRGPRCTNHSPSGRFPAVRTGPTSGSANSTSASGEAIMRCPGTSRTHGPLTSPGNRRLRRHLRSTSPAAPPADATAHARRGTRARPPRPAYRERQERDHDRHCRARGYASGPGRGGVVARRSRPACAGFWTSTAQAERQDRRDDVRRVHGPGRVPRVGGAGGATDDARGSTRDGSRPNGAASGRPGAPPPPPRWPLPPRRSPADLWAGRARSRDT